MTILYLVCVITSWFFIARTQYDHVVWDEGELTWMDVGIGMVLAFFPIINVLAICVVFHAYGANGFSIKRLIFGLNR